MIKRAPKTTLAPIPDRCQGLNSRYAVGCHEFRGLRLAKDGRYLCWRHLKDGGGAKDAA